MHDTFCMKVTAQIFSIGAAQIPNEFTPPLAGFSPFPTGLLLQSHISHVLDTSRSLLLDLAEWEGHWEVADADCFTQGLMHCP